MRRTLLQRTLPGQIHVGRKLLKQLAGGRKKVEDMVEDGAKHSQKDSHALLIMYVHYVDVIELAVTVFQS